MVSKKLNEHITNTYRDWLDYARFHVKLASKGDQAEDILNEVIVDILSSKDESFLVDLLGKKIQDNKRDKEYTELDIYFLKAIKRNCHSPTSPWQHKTRDVPKDCNVNPWDLEIVDQEESESDPTLVRLEKYRRAREILDQLDIPEREKKIFSWKFFEDNPLTRWPGPESYSVARSIFLKIKRKMANKIKNPYPYRRPWTGAEITYLKAEYPHKETIKIAGYLERNYNSVEAMARRLNLKKNPWVLSRIRRRCKKKKL